MKNEDKEAFEKWWHREANHSTVRPSETWLAACDYKQKEINQLIDCAGRDNERDLKLQAENKRLKEVISYLPKVPTQSYEKDLAQIIQKLETENAGLRVIVTLASNASCFTEYEDACSLARQYLKELDEKL